MRARRVAAALVFLAARTAQVHAQAATPPLVVKWNNGLDIGTPDGANDFQIGTLIELDGRFAPDDPLHEVTDTFVMRRVRPIFQGRAMKYFEFRVMPDFGNGQTVLFDAYFDVRFTRTVRLRFGKDKTPLGLEQLYADFSLLLPERTLVTNLVRSLPQAPLTLLDCRSLTLSTSMRQVGAHVVPLLVSHAAPRAWADADFRALGAPEPGGPDDLDGPVAMAMAVERRQERDAAPALVVVGNAQFASNRAVSALSGRVHASFLLSSVNWLRGRRELLGDIPPQRHEGYRLSGSPDDHRGLVWTKSLFYPGVLTPPVEPLVKAGVIALEMELSALLVLGGMLGLRTGGLLVVDGNPTRRASAFDYDPHRPVVDAAIGKSLDVALAALELLSTTP